MKFKLDENFGTRTQHLFQDAGYHVQTVRQEVLQGSPDQHLYEICCLEQRCLVTLERVSVTTHRLSQEKLN